MNRWWLAMGWGKVVYTLILVCNKPFILVVWYKSKWVHTCCGGDFGDIYCFSLQDVYRWIGATPLWVAARLGALDVCRILVKHGADVNFRTHSAFGEWRRFVALLCSSFPFFSNPPKGKRPHTLQHVLAMHMFLNSLSKSLECFFIATKMMAHLLCF